MITLFMLQKLRLGINPILLADCCYTGAGLEKVLYPGILVTSQFPIWQPILDWTESQASHHWRVNSQLLAVPMAQPAIKLCIFVC